jgi:uncharacterized membrane protein YvbJ
MLAVLVIMIALIFTACSQTNEPAGVVKVFLKAVEKQDIGKMQQYLTTQQAEQLHIVKDENFVKIMCGSIQRELAEKGKVKNMLTLDNGDDTATVIVMLENGNTQFGMRKESNGKWKIDVALQ